MSSGTQLIDLVHVDDVVAALRLAGDGASARTLPPGAVYAASGGVRRSVRDLVDVLGRVAGAPVPVEWGARPDRDDEMVEHWDAGPPVPGWQPRVTLDQGLAALLAQPFSRHSQAQAPAIASRRRQDMRRSAAPSVATLRSSPGVAQALAPLRSAGRFRHVSLRSTQWPSAADEPGGRASGGSRRRRPGVKCTPSSARRATPSRSPANAPPGAHVLVQVDHRSLVGVAGGGGAVEVVEVVDARGLVLGQLVAAEGLGALVARSGQQGDAGAVRAQLRDEAVEVGRPNQASYSGLAKARAAVDAPCRRSPTRRRAPRPRRDRTAAASDPGRPAMVRTGCHRRCRPRRRSGSPANSAQPTADWSHSKHGRVAGALHEAVGEGQRRRVTGHDDARRRVADDRGGRRVPRRVVHEEVVRWALHDVGAGRGGDRTTGLGHREKEQREHRGEGERRDDERGAHGDPALADRALEQVVRRERKPEGDRQAGEEQRRARQVQAVRGPHDVHRQVPEVEAVGDEAHRDQRPRRQPAADQPRRLHRGHHHEEHEPRDEEQAAPRPATTCGRRRPRTARRGRAARVLPRRSTLGAARGAPPSPSPAPTPRRRANFRGACRCRSTPATDRSTGGPARPSRSPTPRRRRRWRRAPRGGPSHAEEGDHHEGPEEVPLLLDGERPGVRERRWRRERGEVPAVGEHEAPVGHVADRRQLVAAQRRELAAGREPHDVGRHGATRTTASAGNNRRARRA